MKALILGHPLQMRIYFVIAWHDISLLFPYFLSSLKNNLSIERGTYASEGAAAPCVPLPVIHSKNQILLKAVCTALATILGGRRRKGCDREG